MSRQLWQCSHAKVNGSRIRCGKGYNIGNSPDGTISLSDAAEGKALVSLACRQCQHFDYMGKALPSSERGWIK